MKLYAYKAGSKSAKALADALGIKRFLHEGPAIIRQDFINWGSSNIKRGFKECRILNHPDAVKKASNKLTTLRLLSEAGVSVPEFVEGREAAQFLSDVGQDLVCRHKLTGHSGEGIEIVNGGLRVPDAPLYTVYIRKDEEYRIHVFRGEAFFIQRKARKLDVPDDQVNWKVRNLAGGFIFANKNVEVDDVARNEACNAVATLGLDFGAVDVIRGRDGKFYVLEVNTACGLEGTTLEKYVEKFNQFR